MKFSDLNLEASLQQSIDRLGFAESTPIQAQAMPVILEGKDVAGLAQTGTGKTAAFLIPLMERILRGQKLARDGGTEAEITPRAFRDWKPFQFILVLVPTRELAEQVYENICSLGQESGLRGFAIYGGTGYDKQKEALRQGVEFIVATPGRLIDLYKEHLVDLKQVRAIVFDEADRMFDMGFKDDMKYILQRVPRERQFLVFSATLNFDVLNTAYQFGAEPIELNISRDQAKAENVKDEIFHVGHEDKPQHLLSLLRAHKPQQAIVFTNFKMNVEKIAQFLVDNQLPAMAISSLLTQAQRNKVMQQFKEENDMNILVATDVAARGLDIKGVDLVINFDLPGDSESYVHRIGRTGRAGTEGKAFSLVSDRDVDALVRIEEYLKHKISVGFLEDESLVKEFKPYPQGDFFHSRPFDRGPRNDSRPRGDGRRNSRPGGRGGDSRRERPRRGDSRGESRGDSRSGGPGRGEDRQASGGSREGARSGARDGGHARRDSAGRENASATAGSSGSSQQSRHRDSTQQMNGQNPRGGSGRHRFQKSGTSTGSGPRDQRNSSRPPRRDSGKPTSSRGPRGSSGKASKSIAQKVVGFFKGLVGKSEKNPKQK